MNENVTDADRKAAVALLRAASADDLIHPIAPMAQPLMVDRIAAALAEEREKARAPFLRTAELLERTPLSERESGQISERTQAFRDAAAIIRLTP